MRITLTAACVAVLCLAACQPGSGRQSESNSIVGTWLVRTPQAPFPYHMFVFHSDGTIQQSNPDAGNANTSDSSGMGVWMPEAGRIKGKFVEVTADRTTRRFVSRGEISFLIKVNGDALSGTASAAFYDREGRRLREPLAVTLDGQRIVP